MGDIGMATRTQHQKKAGEILAGLIRGDREVEIPAPGSRTMNDIMRLLEDCAALFESDEQLGPLLADTRSVPEHEAPAFMKRLIDTLGMRQETATVDSSVREASEYGATDGNGTSHLRRVTIVPPKTDRGYDQLPDYGVTNPNAHERTLRESGWVYPDTLTEVFMGGDVRIKLICMSRLAQEPLAKRDDFCFVVPSTNHVLFSPTFVAKVAGDNLLRPKNASPAPKEGETSAAMLRQQGFIGGDERILRNLQELQDYLCASLQAAGAPARWAKQEVSREFVGIRKPSSGRETLYVTKDGRDIAIQLGLLNPGTERAPAAQEGELSARKMALLYRGGCDAMLRHMQNFRDYMVSTYQASGISLAQATQQVDREYAGMRTSGKNMESLHVTPAGIELMKSLYSLKPISKLGELGHAAKDRSNTPSRP